MAIRMEESYGIVEIALVFCSAACSVAGPGSQTPATMRQVPIRSSTASMKRLSWKLLLVR